MTNRTLDVINRIFAVTVTALVGCAIAIALVNAAAAEPAMLADYRPLYENAALDSAAHVDFLAAVLSAAAVAILVFWRRRRAQ